MTFLVTDIVGSTPLWLASEQMSLEFIDAVERGIRRISRSPRVGSLHFAYELAIPDL